MNVLERVARYPSLVFAGLAIVILGPLLLQGYVLTLDMVFAPQTTVPAIQLPGFPFYGLLWLLNLVLPGDVVQKIVLIAIITLSGTGAYRLTAWLAPRKSTLNWQLLPFMAGLLYVCNPFVYSRLMAGQFMVLMGYALLPFFVWMWLRYLADVRFKQAIAASLLAVAIGIVSLHTLGMVVMIAVVTGLCRLWRQRRNKAWLRKALQTGAVFASVSLVLSSYWLIPFLTGHSHPADLVSSFNDSDRSVFATAGSGWGKVWSVITLQGFWADGKNLYVTASERFGWWNLVAVQVLALVGIGMAALWRHNKMIARNFIALGLASIIFACGTTSTVFAPLNSWLIDIIPPLAGYREPQKFVAVLALIYAICASFGLASIWQYAKEHKHPITNSDIAIAMVAFSVLFSPLQFWGLHGQLRAAEYPKDWYAANEKLNKLPAGDVLFLPWHQYMRFSFAGRIVANPANAFFDARAITSNNPELKGLNHWQNSRQQQAIETRILPAAKNGGQRMAYDLQRINVKYVLLVHEHDYQKYTFVRDQPGLKLVSQYQQLELYEVAP